MGYRRRWSAFRNLWTALIAMLVLKYLKSKFSWLLSTLAALLRNNCSSI